MIFAVRWTWVLPFFLPLTSCMTWGKYVTSLIERLFHSGLAIYEIQLHEGYLGSHTPSLTLPERAWPSAWSRLLISPWASDFSIRRKDGFTS